MIVFRSGSIVGGVDVEGVLLAAVEALDGVAVLALVVTVVVGVV